MLIKKIKKRGQVWIETVIYTLIGVIIISLALAFIRPKIEEIQDRGVIEQTSNMIDYIDEKISEMKVSGNKRIVDLEIKKGVLTIGSVSDSIKFEIESSYMFSQPNVNIELQNGIIALTERKGSEYLITLTKDYNSQYNITYLDKDEDKSLTSSSLPYKLVIYKEINNLNFEII